MTIERPGIGPVPAVPNRSRRRPAGIVAGAIALVLLPAGLAAQLPAVPVLQNAWAAPGIVAALDIGGGSAGTVYAAAAAWAPANARLQLSIGAGLHTSTSSGNGGVYGLRLALPLAQLMGGNLGIAAFGGIGGGPGNSTDTVRATMIIPAGFAIGYRRSVGSRGGGFSVYADPSYSYQSGAKSSAGFFRIAVGVDAGLTPRFGLTGGIESGAAAAKGTVGPTGPVYGVGLSMKLRP